MAPQAMVTKRNGKSLPGDDRSAAMDVRGERRKLQVGMDDEDADDERCQRAELHIRRQVIARLQQHPDGQH